MDQPNKHGWHRGKFTSIGGYVQPENITNKALIYATIAHEGQFRNDGITPYIIHPMMVANHVKRYTDDEDIINAAYLHDVIEDTDTTWSDIYAEFGKRVADLVLELTNSLYGEKLSGTNKDQYIVEKMVGMSEPALLIKLADIYDNTRTSLHRKMFVKRRLNMLKQLHDKRPILKLTLVDMIDEIETMCKGTI
jgi:(p)ppGpp synthase/HD superfamily hydrolase